MLTEDNVYKLYELTAEALLEQGISADEIKEEVKKFRVEVPSWVFGSFGGGRFGNYTPPGAAQDRFQKIDDASLVAGLTGAVDRIAVHTAWDAPEEKDFDEISPDDYEDLDQYCSDNGLKIGAVNPTLFLEGSHYGSLSAREKDTRERFMKHCLVSCEIADRFSTGLVTYWLPDGSNYPGQADLAAVEDRVRDSLRRIYTEAPSSCLHLIEYKLFEPGTYSTVVQDAGTAGDLAGDMGDRAGVLVDMGHHAFGVNIARIVARLLARGIPGGFHFNSRYAADDDHAVEPGLRMFEIFHELAKNNAVTGPEAWPFMIDQCSGLENRIQAVLHSIDSLQLSFAKSCIIDRDALGECRDRHDIIRANRKMLAAFLTDLRPVVAVARIEMGGAADPVEAYIASGYQNKINLRRQ